MADAISPRRHQYVGHGLSSSVALRPRQLALLGYAVISVPDKYAFHSGDRRKTSQIPRNRQHSLFPRKDDTRRLLYVMANDTGSWRLWSCRAVLRPMHAQLTALHAATAFLKSLTLYSVEAIIVPHRTI